ncbi:unknown [Ruminococcus sp. CAG:379]|nr:unknown [Ruminococcus sp. CAG:379]
MVTWAACQGAVPVTGKGRAFSNCAVCCNCPGDRREAGSVRGASVIRRRRTCPSRLGSMPVSSSSRDSFLRFVWSSDSVEYASSRLHSGSRSTETVNLQPYWAASPDS